MFHLPKKFYGEFELDKKTSLNTTEFTFFSLTNRIGDILLKVKPSDFNCTPILRKTEDKQSETSTRIYVDYPSGEMFYNFDKKIRNMYGKDSIALMIAISFDEATANSSGSRSECPLTMLIMNNSGDSLQPEFIGFCPLKLPYSEDVLHSLLLNQGCKAKINRQKIILWTKRNMILKYLDIVLSPLLEFEDNGFLAQVGLGKKSNNACKRSA